MNVDGDYTGQFADPFYADIFTGCVPDCAYVPVITASQETTSFAVFLQNEWEATDKLSLIAGLRYWRDEREGAYYGDEPSNQMHIAFDKTQVVGTAFGAPFDESVVPITLTPDDATPTFDDFTARLELDYRVERRPAACSRASTAAARAAASRSRPARRSPISRPSRRSAPTRSS